VNKRQPKPVDEQGHTPIPHDSHKGVECKLCHNVRLNGHPWRWPCTQKNRAEQTYMGDTEA
jgi:hypothetical protein